MPQPLGQVCSDFGSGEFSRLKYQFSLLGAPVENLFCSSTTNCLCAFAAGQWCQSVWGSSDQTSSTPVRNFKRVRSCLFVAAMDSVLPV